MPRSAGQKILDVGTSVSNFIGAGGIASQYGSSIARTMAKPDAKQYVENPSLREVTGSALMTGANFLPFGTMAKGITAGARAIGLNRGVSAIGKIGSGLAGGQAFQAGQNIQENKSALTPGLGTAVGGGIPALGIGLNVLARGATKVVPKLLAYSSDIPDTAFDILIKRRASVAPQIGRATPEQSLADTQGAVRLLRKRSSQEWDESVQAITEQFNGVRTGLNQKMSGLLSKIDDDFPIDLPVNPANMSFQESVDLLKGVNALLRKPLVKMSAQGINVRKFHDEFKNQVVNTFGGEKGPTGQLYKNYAAKMSVFEAANDIVKAYSTNKPIQQSTALGRLKALFNENKGAYLNAIIDLELATGKDLLSGITATKFSQAMPNARMSMSASGGLESASGVIEKSLRLMLFPLTSPRAVSLIVRGLSKLQNAKPTPGFFPGDQFMKSGTGQKLIESLKRGPGLSIEDISKKKDSFKNFTDLSTKLLGKLEGRTTVSKQFISDLTNSPDLKQPERDLFRSLLNDEKDTIDVPTFANKVKSELLPLTGKSPKGYEIEPGMMADGGRYENIVLPDELRGPVANYQERIYESPIKTSAGSIHFNEGVENYFAHTRVEDLPSTKNMADFNNEEKFYRTNDGENLDFGEGDTRRVIELQSDLFQKRSGVQVVDEYSGKEISKANLGQVIHSNRTGENFTIFEKDGENFLAVPNERIGAYGLETADWKRFAEYPGLTKNAQIFEQGSDSLRHWDFGDTPAKEVKKLLPYRNTWHERLIREEVKQAAKDGKTKLQFPTGETAMKIEGLGHNVRWTGNTGRSVFQDLTPDNMKVGMETFDGNSDWIITDVLGDGKFKAVTKQYYDRLQKYNNAQPGLTEKDFQNQIRQSSEAETFDISGKVDTNNPIYKFYEKEVARYLKNKYQAKLITDERGVTWNEVTLTKDHKRLPIEAFGALPFLAPKDE